MGVLSITRTRPSQDLRLLYAIIKSSGRPLLQVSRQISSRRAFSSHYPRRQNPTTATSFPQPSSSATSSSVSASEVSHFTRLASSWWDPHGPSRLLHLMNPLRHDFIKTCLASAEPSTVPNSTLSPKHTILDIGCGGGIFSSSAARLPSTSRVVAIDPTPSVIAVAKSHARSDPVLSDPNKLTYLNCSLDDLQSQITSSSPSPPSSPPSSVPPLPSTYSLITIFELLEHISHPSPFLRTASTYLAPGGWLIGSTIARHPLSFLTTKVIAEMPVFGVVPRGTHTWDQYINPEELEGWFEGVNVDGGEEGEKWGKMVFKGVIYLPGMGWKMVDGSERYGNYFFGVQRLA